MSVEWCLGRSFGLRGDPRQMSSLTVHPIEYRRVSRDAILIIPLRQLDCGNKEKARGGAYIPDNHGSRRPLHSNLEVLAQSDVIV